MKKKDKCCTPKGQVPRYVDCIGCDKKPIETMSKQTAVNVLKQHIQDAIEKTVVDNHYESGYKQCLIDIQNKIDDGLLQMEREQIEDAHYEGYCTIAWKSGDYYNETYGGDNE